MNTEYKVFKHVNKINHKVYVGISRNNLQDIWKDGEGYKKNKDFYNDIKQFGWRSGFDHEIVKSGLTYKEAVYMQNYLITEYDSIEHGYNLASDGFKGSLVKFDFFSFDPIPNPYVEDTDDDDKYFTRISNEMIKSNMKKKYGINRIIFPIIVEIDHNRSLDNTSHLTIRSVMQKCHYKTPYNKPKIFYEVIKCLFFLIESNCIETDEDLWSVGYDTSIPIKVIANNFDCSDRFTKLFWKDYDQLVEANTTQSIESLLVVYLYVCSHIFHRDSNKKPNKYNCEAFFQPVTNIAQDLGMSHSTVIKCLDYLTVSEGDKEPLLVKYEVGSYMNESNIPQNVPNIYVLNKVGYETEIEYAIENLLEKYEVDHFNTLSRKNKENE